ncbi:hypothetical protein IV102_22870 [bacterium]|nr:hypothetical protein [bacterium]
MQRRWIPVVLLLGLYGCGGAGSSSSTSSGTSTASSGTTVATQSAQANPVVAGTPSAACHHPQLASGDGLSTSIGALA